MFTVIEIQKFSDTQMSVVTPIFTTVNQNQAESEFYRLCSVAAVSAVPRHTIVMIRDDGFFYETKTYDHPAS